MKNKILINDDNMVYGKKKKKPDDIFMTNYKINQKLNFENSKNKM